MDTSGIKEVVVIGDIHGSFKTFLALLGKIKLQFPNATIASVGDLIDRGSDSKSVVQYFIDSPEMFVCLANHEDMMVTDILGNKDPYSGEWLAYQAAATLRSYTTTDGLDSLLMREHARWMQKLPLYLEFKDCKRDSDGRHLVVSHSNVGAVWKWSEQRRKDNYQQFKNYIIWDRDGQVDNKEVYNVIGHTPQSDGPKIKSFYANVDTGCCLKREHSELYGVLTGMHYPSMSIIQQENIEFS